VEYPSDTKSAVFKLINSEFTELRIKRRVVMSILSCDVKYAYLYKFYTF
jgi:hypothetical protein